MLPPMADDEYQANWRGARRYQFNEETRRKKAALEKSRASVHQMRFVKWGDPQEKLKVLAEDFHASPMSVPWIDQRREWPETEAKGKIIKIETAELSRRPDAWLDRLPRSLFWILTCIAGFAAFFVSSLAGI